MRLAAYGNFRKGQPMSYYLDQLRMMGKSEVVTLTGVRLHAAGQAPAAVITDDPTDKAVVELIEVDMDDSESSKLLSVLDRVEGVHLGLYKRSLVDTPNGRAFLYEFNNSTVGLPIIEDWNEWIKLTPEKRWELFKKAKQGRIHKPMLVGLT